jgi:hypothetical protein
MKPCILSAGEPRQREKKMGMIFSMMKCKWHKANMSLAQQRLYNIIGRTMETDMTAGVVAFTVPHDAAPEDVAAVKKQFELENANTVKFVTTPPPPAGIDMEAARGELKDILASTVAQLQSIRETSRREIRADLEAIYLPGKPSPKQPGA